MWIQEPINYDNHALWGVSHWGRKRQQFYGFAVNQESDLDVYSKRRIIAVTDLKIVKWHSYKHLDWITVRRDDDKLYKFKEGDFKRMFTRSIVISRRVEDLQLGVESYQKRLNLTKPDMYRSDLKQREAYTAYSNPRGFIYQNKDKKNRLMRIDELHKFSDETLNDVRNALDDRLKGIRMQYLPKIIWKKCDKDRAAAMIQAIDKMLKTRRIMRSLERFVGGRLEDEGDGKKDLSLNIGEEEGHIEVEEEDELYGDTPTSVAPLPMTASTMTPTAIATITTTSQAPILPTTVLSNIIQNLPNFGSLFHFDNRLRSLEASFSKAMQTNQFTREVSAILGIVQKYKDQWMNKEVKVAVQIQSDRLRDEAQRDNDEFLKVVDENIKKIIKEQVKEQVKVQVSKILPRIEQAVNEQLEAKVLTRSSHSSRTSYAVAADLSEMELKKILIEKIEGNKGQRDAEKERSMRQQALQRKLLPGALAEEVFKATTDQLDWVNLEGQQYPHNMLNPLPLIPNNQGHRVIPFEHFINNDLKYLRGGASSQWHSYKHLDWITMRREDDKFYKFKEGDFKRLRIQDIEDMLLLLVQGKLTNLTVEECFACNVSLRMFTRSIVIQRRVEDLQLGVEGYQKKLNLTKPDSYLSDLKCKEAYTAYSNPWGFIYQNKDKRNRLYKGDFKMLQRTI
nr:hypothetical protein [Tanacetum cinerariifolium]